MIKSHFLSMLLPADTTQHTGKNLQQLKTCNSPCKTQPAAAPSNFAGGGGGGVRREISRIYSIQTQTTCHSLNPTACPCTGDGTPIPRLHPRIPLQGKLISDACPASRLVLFLPGARPPPLLWVLFLLPFVPVLYNSACCHSCNLVCLVICGNKVSLWGKNTASQQHINL